MGQAANGSKKRKILYIEPKDNTMGIRSNVGIALVGVALKKKVIEGLSESVKKIFSEADDCLEHKEGSLYIFRDIKWYIETDVEIVTLYDALRDIKNDDYLIVVVGLIILGDFARKFVLYMTQAFENAKPIFH